MVYFKCLLFTILVAVHWHVYAADIVILGLFKDKVVLVKDNKRMVLKTGDITSDGMKVLSVTSKQVDLEIEGQQQSYGLGTQISSTYSAPKNLVYRIQKDKQGMYRAQGKINQHQVKFIVDTGATLLAINTNLAKTLNIPYEKAPSTQVETASGRAKAFRVVLDSVTIGGIVIRDVEAVVVDGDSPKEALLGMSFLKHLRMENTDNLMVLEQKYP